MFTKAEEIVDSKTLLLAKCALLPMEVHMKDETNSDSPLLTVKEASDYLRVSRSTLYRLMKVGVVEPIRFVDRKPLFPRVSLDTLIESKLNGDDQNER